MEFSPSDHCAELLKALNHSDPWATQDRIDELIEKYVEAFRTARENPLEDARTEEDVINYLGAGIVAQIILLGDVLDSPVDLAENLVEQVKGLVESLKPPRAGIDLIYEYRWASDMPGDAPHTKVFRQATEDMEEACRLTRNEAHRLGLPLDGKIVHAESRSRYSR